MRPSRVVVVIDRLSLRGSDLRLDLSQRRALAEALEQALAQRIATGRGTYRSAAVDGFVSRPLELDARAAPRALGAALAGRIWDGLVRTQPQLQSRARTAVRPRRAAQRRS